MKSFPSSSGLLVGETSTASRAVEGIRRLKRWMDDFAHVQTEMKTFIDL
jgi:hypothetical protein